MQVNIPSSIPRPIPSSIPGPIPGHIPSSIPGHIPSSTPDNLFIIEIHTSIFGGDKLIHNPIYEVGSAIYKIRLYIHKPQGV